VQRDEIVVLSDEEVIDTPERETSCLERGEKLSGREEYSVNGLDVE